MSILEINYLINYTLFVIKFYIGMRLLLKSWE